MVVIVCGCRCHCSGSGLTSGYTLAVSKASPVPVSWFFRLLLFFFDEGDYMGRRALAAVEWYWNASFVFRMYHDTPHVLDTPLLKGKMRRGFYFKACALGGFSGVAQNPLLSPSGMRLL